METIKAFQCMLTKSETEISKPISKIGGNPVFFSKTDWPKCRFCGKDMDFICQISLREPLNFSLIYDMAYIFMCSGEFDAKGALQCETWDTESGGNKVILQTKKDTPFVEIHPHKIPNYALTYKSLIEPLIDFTDYEIDEEVMEQVVMTTKIGGVPAWLQFNETPKCPTCGRPMRFVAQIDSELDGPLGVDVSKWGEYNFLNFGSTGIGYLFVCENLDGCDNDSGSFLWQCT